MLFSLSPSSSFVYHIILTEERGCKALHGKPTRAMTSGEFPKGIPITDRNLPCEQRTVKSRRVILVATPITGRKIAYTWSR
jgi:hypothetical protein